MIWLDFNQNYINIGTYWKLQLKKSWRGFGHLYKLYEQIILEEHHKK